MTESKNGLRFETPLYTVGKLHASLTYQKGLLGTGPMATLSIRRVGQPSLAVRS